MSVRNLDRLCAEYGYRMATGVYEAIHKNAENHITKSLSVLQEDGVYAFFLYQASRGKTERPGAECLKRLAAELFRQEGIKPFDSIADPLEAVRGNKRMEGGGLADHLDELLLAKRLLEQALIYARYQAKALEG